MSGIAPQDIEALAAVLGTRVGLTVPDARIADLERGALQVMAAHRCRTAREFCARLLQDGSLLDELIAEFTIGETYFFRDAAHFDLIAQTLLPEILARRAPAHRLRLWSAGCASGEEAWSLAVMLSTAGLAGRA